MQPLRYKGFALCGRAFYILFALVLSTYILFDVLDLDGSNFAKFAKPSHKLSISEFLPVEAEVDFVAKRDAPTFSAIFRLAALLVAGTRLRFSATLFSPLIRTRAHGSILALARNSLPGAPPDH